MPRKLECVFFFFYFSLHCFLWQLGLFVRCSVGYFFFFLFISPMHCFFVFVLYVRDNKALVSPAIINANLCKLLIERAEVKKQISICVISLNKAKRQAGLFISDLFVYTGERGKERERHPSLAVLPLRRPSASLLFWDASRVASKANTSIVCRLLSESTGLHFKRLSPTYPREKERERKWRKAERKSLGKARGVNGVRELAIARCSSVFEIAWLPLTLPPDMRRTVCVRLIYMCACVLCMRICRSVSASLLYMILNAAVIPSPTGSLPVLWLPQRLSSAASAD